MSTASQTPTRRRPMGFAARFALSLVAVAIVLALALRGAWGSIARMASEATLHMPNMALLAREPLAVKVHLGAALLAIVLGAGLMLVRKGRLFHRVAGWVWVSLVSVTAGSTLFITQLNHGSWSFLHLFTAWVLLILPLAVFWAKRHDVARHRKTMMGLFYGGFAINFFIALMPGRLLWAMLFG